jgi:hypothetical protein
VLACAIVASAAAGPRKPSPDFEGYDGITLRMPLAKVKGVGTIWTAPDDGDKVAKYYVHRHEGIALYLGVPAELAVFSASKRLGIVVGLLIGFQGDNCDDIARALEAAWGPSKRIEEDREWTSSRIKASLDKRGANHCNLNVQDAWWDDEHDGWKASKPPGDRRPN